MIAEPKLKLFNDLVHSSTKEEILWMHGYMSGFLVKNEPETTLLTPPALKKKLTILYGTETGNSKKISTEFAALSKKAGFVVKLSGLDQYRFSDLGKEEHVLFVVSTHGDGEPPATAKKFYDFIHEENLLLHTLKYAVLALGDSAYPLFCKTGEDIDARLHNLGGSRITSVQKCDTSYQQDANAWFTNVLSFIGTGAENKSTLVRSPVSPVNVKTKTGRKTYAGKVITNIVLNDKSSDKQTHHIEIVADDLYYQPGDSIGIVPGNPVNYADEILSITGIEPGKTITLSHGTYTVSELLYSKLNVLYLHERTVKKYGDIVGQFIPDTRIGLSDLLKIYPVKDTAQFEEVIAVLDPIIPRLYSISSSLSAHPGEVHITVAKDQFCVNEEVKYGLCSTHLASLSVDSEIEFYIQTNSQFKLPANENDVIMIGPGTGIAPFRSFLHERDAEGAQGRNWLFFGDRKFTTDFLYQTEIQTWHSTGILNNVHVAFSRDQQEKIYVQDKIYQHGKEFFEWIERGAYLYVCGTRAPMSTDVEKTILSVIEKYGNRSQNESEEYLNELKQAGRYLLDVY